MIKRIIIGYDKRRYNRRCCSGCRYNIFDLKTIQRDMDRLYYAHLRNGGISKGILKIPEFQNDK